MKVLLLATSVAICFAAPSLAAPLESRSVAADAKWVVHLDMEAMLNSSLVKKGIDRWIEEENGQQVLDHVQGELGLNLREDVKSITLYNTGYAEHEAVLLVNADFDREKIAKVANLLPDHEVTEVGSIEVHTWTDKEHDDRTVAGAFASDTVLVLGSSLDLTKEALAVIEGDEPSLDGEKSALVRDAAEGTILQAAVVGLMTADVPDKEKLPEGLDEISLAVGEREERTFLSGRIAAKNEATATNIKELLEGARALVMLSPDVEAQGKQHFRKAAIERSGGVVEFELSLPAAWVWDSMEKAEAQKKAGK